MLFTSFLSNPITDQPNFSTLFFNADLLPGWGFDTGVLGRCALGTYSGGKAGVYATNALLVNGADACVVCGTGLTTPKTGSTSVSACVTKPGYGFTSGATATAPVGELCGRGSYNPGGNRKQCTQCGEGYSSDRLRSDIPEPDTPNPGYGMTSFDDCRMELGWGTFKIDYSVANPNKVKAMKCPADTYSMYTTAVYGERNAPCQPCPVGSSTAAWVADGRFATYGAFSFEQCLVDVGYGYDSLTSTVQRCERGSYGLAGSAYTYTLTDGEFVQSGTAAPHPECISCKQGLTTTLEGATDPTACGEQTEAARACAL